MSIKETLEKIKPLYLPLLFIVLASIFFALGRLSTLSDNNTPIKVSYENEALLLATNSSTTINKAEISKKSPDISVPVVKTDGEVIGSKSGKKYYFPWCGTVKRIKPENQVHFKNIEEARASGFTPGGNCKGLK